MKPRQPTISAVIPAHNERDRIAFYKQRQGRRRGDEERDGFVGTNLVEYLSQRGYSVRILDNLSTSSWAWTTDGQEEKEHDELWVADYNDALTFAESDLKANWEVYKERFLRG